MSTQDREAAWAERLARVVLQPDFQEAVRDELRDGPTGVELVGAGWRARIAALPLVRHDGTQAVRIAFHGSEPAEVHVRVGNAETTLTHEGGRTRSLVFVETDGGTQPVRVESRGAFAEAILDLPRPRRWEIYLIHHTHLDIGYTDPQQIVLEQHMRYLDAALELAAATDDWPEPARFRWNVEATLPLERWLAARPRAARDELIERVREGRIEISALAYNMHTEAYSIDELARSLSFADELRELHGVEVVTAMQSDIPGAVPGLATLLTDAGVRYLSVAHNYAGRSVPYLHGGQALRRPFFWRAAGGERLLVWMTDSPHGAYVEGNLLGLAESSELTEELLPEYLAALAERSYPFSQHEWLGLIPGIAITKRPHAHDLVHLRLQGRMGDNAPPSVHPSEIVRDWNERYAVPSLRLATNREFFAAVEARLADGLDEYDGDWADWWADGIGSAARAVGANRRAQGSVRTAQTLHTLADRLGEDETGWRAEVESTYAALGLFDEHTWGAGNPWSDSVDGPDSGALQWERKVALAHDGQDRAAALVVAGAERLAHTFRAVPNTAGSVLVVNGTGHARTDLVRVFVPDGRLAGDGPFALRSPEGLPVPFQLEAQEHDRFRAAGAWLSFVAHDVPACGWARYDFVDDGDAPAAAIDGGSDILDDGRLRVAVDLDRGTVTSVVDLADGTELVDAASAFGFNAYVYDRYTTAPHFNHLSSRIADGASWLLGQRSLGRNGLLVSRESNAVWDALTVRIDVAGAEYLETTYRLVRELGRLDIVNTLMKQPNDGKESVYFVFPFAGEDARVEWEVTGGVAGDGHAQVPGSAQHMRAIRHWATVATTTARTAWATREAPLVQRGDIHLPYRPFPGTVPPGEMSPATIVSWAMNNMWDTNFPPRQGGETAFRYAVAPGGRAVALDLAAALAQPLVGVMLAGRGHGNDDRQTGSLLELDHPEVELVHLAPSRRGHDVVAFLHSHADEPIDVGVAFDSLRVAAVHVGSFLERDLHLLEAGRRVKLAPGELVTLSLDLEPR